MSFQLSTIFLCLEAILLRTAADLQKYSSVAQTIVSLTLANHLPAVFKCIGMHNKAQHIKAGLKLLTAMVMQGTSVAKDVINAIDWERRFWFQVMERKDIKVSELV